MLCVLMASILQPICFENVRIMISRPQNFIGLVMTPVPNFNPDLCLANVRLRIPDIHILEVAPVQNYLHYYFAEFSPEHLRDNKIYDIWYGNYSIETASETLIDTQLIENFDIYIFNFPSCFSAPDLTFIGNGFQVTTTIQTCALTMSVRHDAQLRFSIDEHISQPFNLSYYKFDAETSILTTIFFFDEETVLSLPYLIQTTGTTHLYLFDPQNATLGIEFQVFKRHSVYTIDENDTLPIKNVTVHNGRIFIAFSYNVTIVPEEYQNYSQRFIFHFYQRKWPEFFTSQMAREFKENNMANAFSTYEIEHIDFAQNDTVLYEEYLLVFDALYDIPFARTALSVMTIEHIIYAENQVFLWRYGDSVYTKFDDNPVQLVIRQNELCLAMNGVQNYYKTLFMYSRNKLQYELEFPRNTDECAHSYFSGIIQLVSQPETVILLKMRQENGTFYTRIQDFATYKYSEFITIIIAVLAAYALVDVLLLCAISKKLSFQIPIFVKNIKTDKED